MKKYVPKLLPEIIVQIFFYTVYAVAIAALPYIIKEMIDHDYAAGDVTGDIIRFIALFISCIMIGMLATSQITAGVATATITYIREFSYPLRMVIDSISAMKSVSGVRKKLLAEIVQQYPRGEGITFLKEIQYQDVSVKYENFELQHFSYCFEKGKKYAIIGENGSGKSTVLKLLLGYIVPDTGSVMVDAQNLFRIDATSFIAYIAQDAHIYAEKFMDNVTMFGSYAQDVHLTVKDWNIEESLARIEEKEDCSLLSGGEKQIVSLLRGLLSSRDVLVLDEPFSAVDEQKEQQLSDWLLSTDKTVLMVTHNVQPQFLNKFDAVLYMENGRLVS